MTLKFPDGKYVMFTEGGGGHPWRIIIQFQDLVDMHTAHTELVQALAPSSLESVRCEYPECDCAISTISTPCPKLLRAQPCR